MTDKKKHRSSHNSTLAEEKSAKNGI